MLEWKSPCTDGDWYFWEELIKPVERPLCNELLLFENRCVEPCESDSDSSVDGGVAYDDELDNVWDECVGGGAVE